MKKLSIVISVICAMLLSFGLTACGSEQQQYSLTVNGSDYLYESLHNTYKVGEEVSVKVKIKPYEGVKVLLDDEALVKAKSAQNDYWQFTFEMPAHDATLDITYYEWFDEPILYGFYIAFRDKNGDPIEEFNKDVKSAEAIADYATPYYDENGVKVYTNNVGANVFADSKEKVSNIGYELENTLYFTYELLGAVACVDFVYFDVKTQEVSTYDNAGHQLSDIGYSSTFGEQHLSDIRFNGQMKEYEERFDSNIKLNMKYLDYLTGVKILEYGTNNELIKSTDIAKAESEITYAVGEGCDYVVIEEEYTVKNDEAHNGETYCERTLINKSKFGDGKMLKYPRGDGLILPVYLSVKWQTETDE